MQLRQGIMIPERIYEIHYTPCCASSLISVYSIDITGYIEIQY